MGASAGLWGLKRAYGGLCHVAQMAQIAFPLGFKPLFGLISCPDRFPARARATFRPQAPKDRQHRPQERPRTANIGPKSGPRPPT